MTIEFLSFPEGIPLDISKDAKGNVETLKHRHPSFKRILSPGIYTHKEIAEIPSGHILEVLESNRGRYRILPRIHQNHIIELGREIKIPEDAVTVPIVRAKRGKLWPFFFAVISYMD